MRVQRSWLVVVVAACGGARPHEAEQQGEHETERGAIPDDVVGPPNVAWKDLDHDQRVQFMKRVVVPTMQPLFVAFDGATFHDFSCATCHGSDHAFAMPNPNLFVLPNNRDDYRAMAAAKPTWVQFMSTEVEPEMAKLLAMPEADAAHPDGFGCTACHYLKK